MLIKSRTAFVLCLLLLSFFSRAQEKKWTLRECVEHALKNNISVRQSELDLQLTEIDKSDALGNFIPTANANAQHAWNSGLNPNPVSGGNSLQTTMYTTAGFGTQVDIYKGLQNQARYRRAKMAIIAGQYQLQKMKDDTGLNVANAYLQILFNRENLKVQKEQLAADIRQSERSAQLLEGGQIPKGDLLDVEATVAADKQRVIAAENQLLLSKLSLAQLLQLKDFKNFDVADEEYDMNDNEILFQTPEAIFEKAKTIRTEIKLAQANLEVAKQDVKISRSAYQPTLRGFYNLDTRVGYADVPYLDPVTGQYDYTRLVSPPRFVDQFWDNKGHSYGFQLSVPVFNGFSTRNAVKRSKIALSRSELAYEQQELDLERNVYTAFTDAQGALKAYDAAVSAANARAQALSYATDRYDVGLINVFDLNQAQTLSVNAQSEVARTKYDYLFRVKILEFYFGLPIFQK
jgi:outer membrane protein